MSTPYATLLPRRVPRSAASQAWGISFGDLITLLLCFFIAFIPRALQNRSGTPVALKGVEIVNGPTTTGIAVPLTGFTGLQELAPEWQLKIVELLSSGAGQRTREVLVKGCEAGTTGMGLLRAIAVTRQITDTTGIDRRLVVAEPESSGCAVGNGVEIALG